MGCRTRVGAVSDGAPKCGLPLGFEHEFYEALNDLNASRSAVAALTQLLVSNEHRQSSGPPTLGTGVLLEGAAQRLNMALDAMVVMGQSLGLRGSAQAAGHQTN